MVNFKVGILLEEMKWKQAGEYVDKESNKNTALLHIDPWNGSALCAPNL